MFSQRDIAAVKAIVSVFETGSARGIPSALTVLADGAGISYGFHQATHRSGALHRVVARYLELDPQSEFASALRLYLPRLKNTSRTSIAELSRDTSLHKMLRRIANLSAMHKAQADVFEQDYLRPAIRACHGSGFVEPLSLAVVYDSYIHGSYTLIRDRVSPNLSERKWIESYCQERATWLETHPKQILRNTINRPHTFLRLIREGNWKLKTPFRVQVGKSSIVVANKDLGYTGDHKESLSLAQSDSSAVARNAGEDTVSTVQNIVNQPREIGNTVRDVGDLVGQAIAIVRPVVSKVHDIPIQVTNSRPTRVAVWLAGLFTVLQSVWAWLDDKVVLLAVCVAALAFLVSIYFVCQFLIERERLRIASDPTRYTVK